MSMTVQSERSLARQRRRQENRMQDSHATSWTSGFVVKLILMALVNALGIYVVFTAFGQGSRLLGGLMGALVVFVDWVYFSKRTLALKYLTPGLVFLLVFQAFTIVYTGYIAFTNYGHQHTLSKPQAINALLLQNNFKRVEGSPQYPLALVHQGGELGFAVIDDGELKVGTAEQPLQSVDGEIEGTRIVSVDGWEPLASGDLASRQQEIIELRVPLSDDPQDGSIGTQTGTTAFQFTSSLTYDDERDAMINTDTGEVYYANGDTGFFETDGGQTLGVGWRVNVGFDNFVQGFSDSRYAQPFFSVLIWNVIFAAMSVLTTFILGMVLAIVMNDERMRGRRFYRTMMLLPYAFPSFMTAFLFAGLMNARYGFFNEMLGIAVPWLTDPTMAKVSVILVNLWMGFPYMFLIVTGALQSIPGDLVEAAKIDGASTFQVWRNVTLPQLMISLTPLLISSFAFNFNNFNLIYMLNGGGPSMPDASVPVGYTDILISMVYKIAGLTGEALPNYGLAAAMSLVIFLIVGSVSLYSFRKSNAFEGLGA